MKRDIETVDVNLNNLKNEADICEKVYEDDQSNNKRIYDCIKPMDGISQKKKEKFLISKTKTLTYINHGDLDIVWKNAVVFGLGHIAYLYAFYVSFAYFSWKVQVCNLFVIIWAGFGVTAGAHRLWAHKSYKAKLPLRIFLMIGQCVTGQNCIYIWARDHRIHHKYSDTDADPHNARRGFFFSHVGWLMAKKHPEVKLKGQVNDFSDLRADPVVKYQEKYYYWLFFLFAIFLPVYIPMYFWNEPFVSAFFVCFVHRLLTTLHITWFVNSAAHMFGDRPYDGHIPPAENPYVSVVAFGEGWHNYHHKFPFDYKTSESNMNFNHSKGFIELMAKYGQAYDLRSVTEETLRVMKEKTAKGEKSKFFF